MNRYVITGVIYKAPNICSICKKNDHSTLVIFKNIENVSERILVGAKCAARIMFNSTQKSQMNVVIRVGELIMNIDERLKAARELQHIHAPVLPYILFRGLDWTTYIAEQEKMKEVVQKDHILMVKPLDKSTIV